jgi:hypothetical protein
MIRRLTLMMKDLADPKVRENFRRVADYLRDDPFARGQFQHFTLTLTAPTYPATVTVPHGLSFRPTDVIQTAVSGGAVTWLFDNFTATDLSISIAAATTVRAFIGAYGEGRTV